MEKITQRQQLIVEFLLKNGQSKCKWISKDLNVSDKTIRNEIKLINQTTTLPLISSDLNGFYIQDEHINEAIQLFKFSYFDENGQLLRHLLLNKLPNDFYEIADSFCFSPSSLQNKVKNLNTMILSYNLEIERKNVKLVLKGSEFDRHKLFLDLLYHDTDYSFSNLYNYSDFFPDIDLGKAHYIIKESIASENYFIPSFYENNLIINILTIISLYSNKTHPYTATTKGIPEEVIANKIVNQLTNDLNSNSNLVNMITYSLTGIIKSKDSDESEHKPYSSNFINSLYDIVKDCFTHFGINSDPLQFINIFADHIHEMVQRLRSGNYFAVSENLSIKLSSLYVYDVAVYLSNKINEHFNVHIPEDEISLIAVHIGFAIESSFNKNSKIKVFLYSGKHPMIEQHISKNIISNFNDKIDLVLLKNFNELSSFDNIDLLITTEPFYQGNVFEYCKISAFFSDTDRHKISHSISRALTKQDKKDFNLLVQKYFDKDLFFKSDTIDNRDDALNFLNNKMLKKGVVDETYIDSVIYRESLNPTCFMNAFAIPHSFEANSIKSNVAVLINPNGIKWENQVVKIVFLIAINENDSVSKKKLLDGLSTILSNEMSQLSLEQIDGFVDFLYYITK